MWQWIKDNKDQLEICIAFIGFAGTVFALFLGARQLQEGANALQASTIYQIQKDGRDLREATLKEPDYIAYVEQYDPSKTYSEDVLNNAARRVGIILQFYSAIYA